MKVIKNIILLLLIILCLFLSSRIWLQLPDFLKKEDIEPDNSTTETVNMWKIVKPVKYFINDNNTNYIYNSPEDYKIWEKTVDILQFALNNFTTSRTDLSVGEKYPENNIAMEFNSDIPIEIFLERFGLNKKDLRTRLNYIKKVVIDINDANSIYIFNGDSTVSITNTGIDSSKIVSLMEEVAGSDYKQCNLDSITLAELLSTYFGSDYTQYNFDNKIEDININLKYPEVKTALNPVYVKSEIDINNNEYIEKIAKDYFGSDYDYVRKSKEIEGNVVFVYKNEKVLRISSEGLLDFYDATVEDNLEGSIYQSLVTALNFTNNFLEFPEDVYLSRVDTIELDGSFGYKFVFSYRILNNPIIFSSVRESQPLEVQVVGNKVVSYKRLIRNIDDSRTDEMIKEKLPDIKDIIIANLELGNNESDELKVLSLEDVYNIEDIFLGYFDRSRRLDEQQLYVVWVIKIKDKSYIFNAMTGAPFEIIEGDI